MSEELGNTLNQALPYVDRELDDPDMALRVEEVIREEIGKGNGPIPTEPYEFSFEEGSIMGKTLFICGLPSLFLMFFGFYFLVFALLANEFERMQNGVSMPKLDFSRYEMSLPSDTMLEDPHAWKKKFVMCLLYTFLWLIMIKHVMFFHFCSCVISFFFCSYS